MIQLTLNNKPVRRTYYLPAKDPLASKTGDYRALICLTFQANNRGFEPRYEGVQTPTIDTDLWEKLNALYSATVNGEA